jgi:Ca2+-transporting ATPase
MKGEWYRMEAADVLERLSTDAEDGLDQAEAERRLAEHGWNELIERGARGPLFILWQQLTEVMVLILIAAGVISALLGDAKDTVAILAIVVLNAVLGFVQEYQAEQAIAALKKLAVPVVKVRRGGQLREMSARELVPGDVVMLEAGGMVPADGRLLESANLRVQEATLTGESEAVNKRPGVYEVENLPLGDRRNMVYLGTVVTYGRGTAVIAETGMNTELGHIAEMIQTVEEEPTPLQRRLAQLGRGMAVAALVIVALVFVLGLLRGEDVQLMFLTGISMAVAAVPEGLPAVVTITLALGAQRMLRRQALIRELPAVETLGSVTVICSDKTGTLTQNRMTVTVLDIAGHTLNMVQEQRDGRLVWTLREEAQTGGDGPIVAVEGAVWKRPDPTLETLLVGATLCNDAVLELREEEGERNRVVGDPTEGALVTAAAEFGLLKPELERSMPRVAEVPFSSERKRMTTVHEFGAEAQATAEYLCQIAGVLPGEGTFPYLAFTKGAINSVLEVSDRIWVGDQCLPLTDHWIERVEAGNDRLADDGMRVLGVAVRPLEGRPAAEDERALEQKAIFVGLIGMIDPPRPEVKDAVATCKSAGMRAVMITGDHPLTARYIAEELDIYAGGPVLTGQDLTQMTVEELDEVVEDVSVYARVSPEHKLKIVQALVDHGHVVAMTGDGVNDAPALKKADIGVAMGITGTDVAKEAAEMVLLDDNFATIVAAVEEGRVIYDNIRKFIRYTLTSNVGELWVMLLAPLLGMPLPLLPLQVLWVNLVTDGLPGLALSVEPPERGTMRRPPYHPRESIFGRGLGRDILWVGPLMGMISLGLGLWAWGTGHTTWQTMVFTTLTLSQMANALAVRSEQDSLFSIGLLSNKPLLGAILLTFVLQMAVVYVPFLQTIFKTEALPLDDLVISLILSTLVLWGIEIQKWVLRRS